MAGYDSDNEDFFYEIEYDACPMPGVGRFVRRPNKIQRPERDAVRERFDRMRDIARAERSSYFGSSRFYDSRTRAENSRIFYKQGKFMEDFEDDCEKAVPCSAYFTDYQMLGYDQLRTYFTWRTNVRQGEIQNISLSYAFLYVYELLNNIGVEGPEEALEALMDFWDVFRFYAGSIDKYMIRWLKDYHIYYELPWSFKEFAEKNGIAAHYPTLSDPKDRFGLLSAVSAYDIRKSKFFPGREELIRDCFNAVTETLDQALAQKGLSLDAFVFHTARKMPEWTPFKGALFYPHIRQRDRRVVLSEKEVYLCSENKWSCSAAITMESGKGLIGYVMKQEESLLRKALGYPYKLSARPDMIGEGIRNTCAQAGISVKQLVTESVMRFYREATRTVVRIDEHALEKIRREALITQEKLMVPEEEPQEKLPDGAFPDTELEAPEVSDLAGQKEQLFEEDFSLKELSKGQESAPLEPVQERDLTPDTPWEALWQELSCTEREALHIILQKESAPDRQAALKLLTDRQGMMLEVLAEGINEKAMDFVGDALLDEEFAVYEDYTEQLKGIMEEDIGNYEAED